MVAIPWKYVGIVWGYASIWAFILHLAKLGVSRYFGLNMEVEATES